MASSACTIAIPETFIAGIRRFATAKAITLGLTGSRLDDYVGDALLALCLLAAEWNPDRGVPLEAWVQSHLVFRINDLVRQRTPGYRAGRHLEEAAHDPHGAVFSEVSDTTVIEDSTIVDIEAAVTDDRERFIVRCLTEGWYQREIAAAMNVSETRVRQLIFRIRDRLDR